MMHIYTTCGVWEFGATTRWVFSADEKGARLLLLESNSTLEVFKRMVLEDFDMEEDSLPDLELSYLPTELINTSTCPPVIIANDRQLQNFVGFVQKCFSTRLCVTSKAKVENLNEPDFDLNKSPADSSTAQEEGNSVDRGNEPAHVFVERQCEKNKEKISRVEVDEDAYHADTMISAKEDIHKMSKFSVLNIVKKGQLFENKTLLKATFEICAMKHNFHYEVIKTDRQLWYVRCEDNACNWCVRAECLKDSAYFIIKKISKTKSGRTASAKTIDVEKKIERRTEKGKRFAVYPVSDGRLLVREAWREAYHESINPIVVLEDAWSMPEDVVVVNVLPPESRKSVGTNRKRRYETVEDKIRSSQTSQKRQPRKCSRCGISGNNRATCWSVQVCKLWCLKVQYCLVSYGFFF
uniref:Transposase MuDR plant domain-containing protein n=1 Tax=Brassica oleracea var. oleracea TaxID=109376 RepID=A0A0D3DBZ7_BRAOL